MGGCKNGYLGWCCNEVMQQWVLGEMLKWHIENKFLKLIESLQRKKLEENYNIYPSHLFKQYRNYASTRYPFIHYPCYIFPPIPIYTLPQLRITPTTIFALPHFTNSTYTHLCNTTYTHFPNPYLYISPVTQLRNIKIN